MKIEADKRPKDDKEFTIADVKAFFAKLELLNVPDNARLKGRLTVRNYVFELIVDTDDLRPIDPLPEDSQPPRLITGFPGADLRDLGKD